MEGKLHDLVEDEDLSSMYEVFKTRKNFMLWIKCQVKLKKRPTSLDSTSAGGGAFSGQSVLDLFMSWPSRKCMKLMLSWQNWKRSMRGSTLGAAKMLGKYDSDQAMTCLLTNLSSQLKPQVSLLPLHAFLLEKKKKKKICSECIQQLDKWHDLKVRGIITEDQYKDFKETILSDMKNFWLNLELYA